MNWFYAQNGQQVGPVDEGLVQRGAITPATLVWRNGMANWQPYAEVRPANAPAVAAPVLAKTPAGPIGAGEARCTECGQIFPEDEVVRLGAALVCARCKPLVLQKLREGVPVGTLPYAGFWVRFGAAFFDFLIQLPIYLLVWFGIIFLFPQVIVQNGENPAPQLLLNFFFIAFNAGYDALFVGRFGATPGKMICNLRVVRADGSKLSYGRALGRHFAKWVSQIVLCVGYIIAAFDDQKRALHDHMCDTRVVYKS
jgi:uncharacterized RDD family membrane protein YckC